MRVRTGGGGGGYFPGFCDCAGVEVPELDDFVGASRREELADGGEGDCVEGRLSFECKAWRETDISRRWVRLVERRTDAEDRVDELHLTLPARAPKLTIFCPADAANEFAAQVMRRDRLRVIPNGHIAALRSGD